MGTTTISGSTKLPYSTIHSLLESGGIFPIENPWDLYILETHLAVLDPEIKSLNGLFSHLNNVNPQKV